MKTTIIYLILSFYTALVYSQDHLGKWNVSSATYNGSSLSNASGYLNFKSSTEYEASFKANTYSGYVDALYTMSEFTFLSNIDGKNLVINGMSMVTGSNGYFTSISCSSNAFQNYVGPAIGYGKPKISISENSLTLKSADGKAVIAYKKVTTSIFELTSERKAVIFPNPAKETCKVKIPQGLSGDLNIRIFNTNGVEILTKKGIKEELFDLDLSGLNVGLYYVRISAENYLTNDKLIIAK